MRAVLLALAVSALATAGWGAPGSGVSGSGASGAEVQLDFSNPGLSPSHWILTIYPDGNGHFRSERGAQSGESRSEIEPIMLDRDIRVTSQFADRVFQTAQRHHLFKSECDSHMKVAFQGWKKLSYSGPDGEGVCEFNYSKDKEIQELADALISVAATVSEGARLESLMQHDRLGLDREMEYLMEAAGDGRVQQICTIRGTLEHLAEDENVLDRVRKRARTLLAMAEK
jgi:hypothetical protein